jgi:hypothetical protein
VPVIRYATKSAAGIASRSFLRGTTAFGVLATLLGLAPGAEYGAASSSLISISLGYLSAEAQSAANDPPRADYWRGTRSKRRRLPSVSGSSDVARASESFGESAAYAASYLSAFVRALERSQMAEAHKEFETMRQRLREANEYAARSSSSLNVVSRQAEIAADAFEADTLLRREARRLFEGSAGRQLLDTPYWEKLPPDVIALFEENDIDPRSLRNDWQDFWEARDPVGSCANVLREASTQASLLGESLSEWGPEEPQDERLT